MSELVLAYDGELSHYYYCEDKIGGVDLDDAIDAYNNDESKAYIKLHPISIALILGRDEFPTIEKDRIWPGYIQRLFMPEDICIPYKGGEILMENYLFAPNDYAKFNKEHIALRILEIVDHPKLKL